MKKETINKMQEAFLKLEIALNDLNNNNRFTESPAVKAARYALAECRTQLEHEIEQPAAPPAPAP